MGDTGWDEDLARKNLEWLNTPGAANRVKGINLGRSVAQLNLDLGEAFRVIDALRADIAEIQYELTNAEHQ